MQASHCRMPHWPGRLFRQAELRVRVSVGVRTLRQAGMLASVGAPDCSGTPLAAAVIAETTSEGAM